MAGNRIEHVLADLGSLHAGGVPMSIYTTLSAEPVTYVARHSEPTVVILESEEQLRRWGAALAHVPSIRAGIVLDDAESAHGVWAQGRPRADSEEQTRAVELRMIGPPGRSCNCGELPNCGFVGRRSDGTRTRGLRGDRRRLSARRPHTGV